MRTVLAAALLGVVLAASARAQFCGEIDQSPFPPIFGDTLGGAVAIEGEWAFAGDTVEDLACSATGSSSIAAARGARMAGGVFSSSTSSARSAMRST